MIQYSRVTLVGPSTDRFSKESQLCQIRPGKCKVSPGILALLGQE